MQAVDPCTVHGVWCVVCGVWCSECSLEPQTSEMSAIHLRLKLVMNNIRPGIPSAHDGG